MTGISLNHLPDDELQLRAPPRQSTNVNRGFENSSSS